MARTGQETDPAIQDRPAKIAEELRGWMSGGVACPAQGTGRSPGRRQPQAGDGSTSPQQIVSNALSCLQNQQSRMNDPQFRRDRLPITSCHIESTNKQLNHRVKGTEKSWSSRGGKATPQTKAVTLCDTAALDRFQKSFHNPKEPGF
ncbi:MAG: hypothetical protein ACE5KM_04665 [Planctomycetaceae bacterium]